MNVSSIKYQKKKKAKAEREIIISCSQSGMERNMNDEILATLSCLYLLQMKNLKPRRKIILLVILEDKWKSSLSQRPEIIISCPSSKIYEILYHVKRNCRCISPERGEKKTSGAIESSPAEQRLDAGK